MGCLVGLVAAVAAVGFGWLAYVLGASLGVVAIVMVGVYLLPAALVVKYGHVGFGGGGPTDLLSYVFIFGVAAALLIPRFESPIACERVQRHLD